MARSTIYNVCMSVRAMQEATFLILTALADGSQHGYGIITEVQEISGDRIRLRPGTLYTVLDRLREDELIGVERSWTGGFAGTTGSRPRASSGSAPRRPGCRLMPAPR
jgi:Transcriptional regulator PadR-like family